ncbi:MAG TPA: apolipoprotein N-acyltransferase [Usitatibacter sp.]|nr:apolipoprotein N-acyltransferase [Usitatibacter sp.]
MTPDIPVPPSPAGGGWLRAGVLPFAAGALAVGGFAPLHAWPLPILALAVLFHAWSRSASARAAALSGLAFGMGCFLVGVSWVYISLHRYGDMAAPLAAIATMLFCAYLAIFPALAGALVVRLGGPRPAVRLAAAPAAYTLLEWLRGTLFTGCPWLNVGTSQAPSAPLAGFAPIWGAYGVMLLAAMVATLLAVMLSRNTAPRMRVAALAAIVAMHAGGFALRQVEWTRASGPAVRVALIQGNVPQEMKWRDEVRMRTIQDYGRMIEEAQAPIVVIPETALPAFLDELPRDFMQQLLEHARRARKEILLGTVERVSRPGGPDQYYNSLVRITGTPPQSYRKRHLVPFGEYIPPGFHWVLDILHIPMQDFDSGPDAQPPLPADGVSFGVAICYEDIFGSEMASFLPAARAFVNVSNMAWFGDSLAPEQQLQESQMRALENGRWMVRATNTGVTAAIGPDGHVESRLPTFTRGTLIASIEPREGMTPYARTRNLPALWAAAAILLLCAAARRRAPPDAVRGA